MKKLCIILSLLLIVKCGKAQTCLPEGITFLTQEQVDGFQGNYPGCVSIEGNVLIKGGNDITDLTGLDVLTSIGGNLAISFNYALTSLEGLEGLNSIGGDLNIFGNTMLTSLAGLDSIEPGSIISLRIAGNDLLSTCAIQSICDFLASPNGTIEIHTNAAGCNSPEEVEEACIYLSNEEVILPPAFSLFPNPSSTIIIISALTTPNKNTILTIFNINGQQLIRRPIKEQQTVIDVSVLPQGIYFVKMASDDGVQMGKFVKQ